MTSILIVEDDPLVSRFLERGLRAAGYTAVVAGDVASASVLGLSGAFDLLLLDLVLGDGDGFTVLRMLRERRRTLPVLVMTGYPKQRDVVDVLDGDADDYLVKPVRFDEVLARVRLRLGKSAATTSNVLATGDLRMELLTRRITVGDHQVELTAREYTLLETFMRHPDQVLSREQLLSRVWGYDFDPTSNVVNVYIAALRGKIGSGRIETLRGTGYRLRNDPVGAASMIGGPEPMVSR